MPQNKYWKVLDLLNTTTDYFVQKGIENARLNTEQLLGKALNMDRVNLYVSFERPVTENEITVFRDFVKRRTANEPLQYILGETEFMGLPFKVNPAVLIPRPETETLVEEVLKLKNLFTHDNPVILDIGSGSGCIPISLAHFWPNANYLGLDISQPALEIAVQNATTNGMDAKVDFEQHDIFTGWNSSLPLKVDILVSNPPYIATSEIGGLSAEVRDFEPRIALSDDADGLSFYRRLFDLCSMPAAPHCTYLFVEMSGSQPEVIIGLAQSYNFLNIDIIKDLNNIPRVLKVTVTNE